MKKILISMMLLVSMVTACAQTGNDEFTKEVNRAVELQNVTSNFSQMMTQQMQPLVNQGMISAQNLSALIKDVEAYAAPLLKKKMAELYRKNFTLDELKQINAYLSSPAGQKALKLMPEFAAEGMKIMQTPEAQKKIQELALKYLSK
ncbi:MAG: DUF2059 domain-containing protein [Bacteroidaceae bacterium]|nr:DUF2059 domain-containing protein [Bacteroidaceae bacterium]